jgi:hypothetical protein
MYEVGSHSIHRNILSWIEPATVAQVEIEVLPKFAFNVGDKIIFKGKEAKITHRLDKGKDGLTWYGFPMEYQTSKGASTTIIFRPESDLQAVKPKAKAA